MWKDMGLLPAVLENKQEDEDAILDTWCKLNELNVLSNFSLLQISSFKVGQ